LLFCSNFANKNNGAEGVEGDGVLDGLCGDYVFWMGEPSSLLIQGTSLFPFLSHRACFIPLWYWCACSRK
jgi:hypothetical protein